MNGHLSTVFFKSVGLNVASDTFVQLSLVNIIGGMVIVLGDDPGANSSQNEQDNRHYARMTYTPVFEPANPKKYKVSTPDLDDPRMQNIVVLAVIDQKTLIPGIETGHYTAVMKDLMAGVMLEQNMRLFIKNIKGVPV